jgi:hypothetical protein
MVMVLAWDFDYTDDPGREVTTRNLAGCCFVRLLTPYPCTNSINDGLKRKDKVVENLFAVQDSASPRRRPKETITDEETKRARIYKL